MKKQNNIKIALTSLALFGFPMLGHAEATQYSSLGTGEEVREEVMNESSNEIADCCHQSSCGCHKSCGCNKPAPKAKQKSNCGCGHSGCKSGCGSCGANKSGQAKCSPGSCGGKKSGQGSCGNGKK